MQKASPDLSLVVLIIPAKGLAVNNIIELQEILQEHPGWHAGVADGQNRQPATPRCSSESGSEDGE